MEKPKYLQGWGRATARERYDGEEAISVNSRGMPPRADPPKTQKSGDGLKKE